ncbi:MAG TPA: hypothetical protein VFQ25_06710 [Ktedonobacterales bacterium]|nr:hypothetical protein [Ktedonobacterales bacterium]
MSEAPARTQAGVSAVDEKPLTPAERVAAWLMPSLGDALFICVFAFGLIGLQGRVLGVDGDAGWNIALGAMTLRHGLPRTEPFLSTMLGQPVVHWEWLTQVVYGAAYMLGGLNGVVAVASALVALTVRGLYEALRRRGMPALAAVALACLGGALVALSWTARAQLFSLLFTLWWGEWLWRYWRDGARWRLGLFPAATALWANFHAGYLAGFALLGAAAALAFALPPARRVARPGEMALALTGSVLATLLTPWGFDYWRHLVTFARNPLIPLLTQEYQSPNFHLGLERLFLGLVFALVGVWLLAVWRAGGRGVEPLGLTLCALWTALSFVYVRFVPLWPLICLPYLGQALMGAAGGPPIAKDGVGALGYEWPEHTDGWRGRVATWLGMGTGRMVALSRRVETVDRLLRGALWSVVAVGLGAALVANGGALPGQSRPLVSARWDAAKLPVAAMTVLRSEGIPPGRGFNPYEWGGYLDYALPGYHVFIDSRSDVYSSQFLRDYLTITGVKPGWSRLLDQYHIEWALIQADAPLRQALALSGWRCQAEGSDGVAALCLRPTGGDEGSARVTRMMEYQESLWRRTAGRVS